ncbi:hypothetical protein [Azospirillum halopraeferens]|uniref:hypothetical protein n=1 Tax=Azospirillum halopraeferens TaxID=34010 RepID=UPI0004167FEC|nr:hypothetical protein [Azospirillum halopraeferens]
MSPGTDDPDAGLPRLSPEELAILLGGGLSEEARERQRLRNARANTRRTDRRRSDPAFAEALRTADRARQRRKRAAAERSPRPPAPAAPLPALTPLEAARRLERHLESVRDARTAQLRSKPDLVQRCVDGFTVYRHLSADGTRPTRGAMAAAFRDLFGVTLTPSQVQNVRDRVEDLARPGGPWHGG